MIGLELTVNSVRRAEKSWRKAFEFRRYVGWTEGTE